MPDQFSAAASTYGWGTFAALAVLVVVGLVAANWQHIKALAGQAKPVADPIEDALDIARQLDALHVRLGLTDEERRASFHAVMDRGFAKAKAAAEVKA